ncbi:hypothetical protein MNEG_2079 [Monoraphidium neglectum]|uniref:Uncharacterized protein n=1 Tax=Monoraphidium neglectum TaxID=145388 RepID=A0A0D2MZY7_9CHLO|nr:hypothetical protein MNEG_2079 [Monoraphidium neglectum]KIZ05872.1 hypothetical protein MNEG_2079 [Monoraphidium neglectum]|eukprot:XP_013904891.1 hypothetical protein MNEG_2079 [Monoraphidium neglectum]
MAAPGLGDDPLDAASLATYAQEVRRAIATKESDLALLREARSGAAQVAGLLATLPGRLRHPVMVPFGRHAFFPGELVHTNELTVHLGGQYYAEMPAPAARDAVQRRAAALGEGIEKAEQQLRALRARLDVSATALGGGGADSASAGGEREEGGVPLMEIRETEAEAEAWLQQAQGDGSSACGGAETGTRGSRSGGVPGAEPSQSAANSNHPAPLLPPESATTTKAAVGAADAGEADDLWQALMRAEREAEEQDLSEGEAERRAQGLLRAARGRRRETPGAGSGGEQHEPATSATATTAAAVQPSSGRRVSFLDNEAAATDSDDEDSEEQPVRASAREMPALAPLQQAGGPSAPSQPPQQQPSPSSSAPLSKVGPKSILKKGFLGSGGAGGTSSSSDGAKPRRAPSAAQAQAAAAAAARARPAAPVRAMPAVIGAVVERPTPGTGTVAAATNAGLPAATAPQGRMSRFKMQRMGLQPDDEGEGAG